MSFSQNLDILYEHSPASSWVEFASFVGINRSVLSNLRSGRRQPTKRHLQLLAAYAQIDAQKFLQDTDAFSLSLPRSNRAEFSNAISTCVYDKFSIDEIKKKYVGYYNIYTQLVKNGETFGSYLSIQFSRNIFPEFNIINPFPDGENRHKQFSYSGFVCYRMGTLYLVGAEDNNQAGVILLSFLGSTLKKPLVLDGILSGIGIFAETETPRLAAVPALGVRRRTPMSNWRDELGETMGRVSAATLPEYARRRLSRDVLGVPKLSF